MIAKYRNGDYTVEIHEDGTKIRTWESLSPKIEFPESIDMKITDFCDLGCKFCHEKSTTRGKDANVFNILNLVKGLPSGVELALGGGNPLDFSKLDILLDELKSIGIVANVTVNENHIDFDLVDRINMYRKNKLVHGLGVSVTHTLGWREICDKNTVAHIIIGVSDPSIVKDLLSSTNTTSDPVKILLLGYKEYGRGVDFYNNNSKEINRLIDKWKFFLPSMINSNKFIVSFDNLALKQLDVKNMVPENVWESSYMGSDGEFTMYVDAVNMEYSVSSTNVRKKIGKNETIMDLFSKINEKSA